MEVAPEEVAECPSCRAIVAFDATLCPSCGEVFPEELSDDSEHQSFSRETERASASSRRPAGLRERLLFYAGILLILLGGPGIALGSWLHDALHIGIMNYNAFDVFGPVNRLVVALGLIVTIVGIVLFILSLRLARPSAEEREIRESPET
jgi:hypothetical protein